MDGGSAPPAPDYKGAAEETAAGNLQNLNAQTAANRPDQYTPWGSSTWQKNTVTDQDAYNKALADWNAGNSQGTWVPGTDATTSWQGGGEGGQMVTTPGVAGHWEGATSNGKAAPTLGDYTRDQWTQTLQLTPDQQKALDDQMAIQANQSGLAKTLQGQVASTMAGGFNAPQFGDFMKNVGSVNQNFGNFDPSSQTNLNFRSGAQRVNTNIPMFGNPDIQAGAQAAYDSSHSLIADQQQQDKTNLDSQLRIQGLQPGTEAYNNAYQNLQRTQAQQNNNLASQATLTGNQMANQNYQTALAGYGAKNAAIGQQYGQDTTTFNTRNNAQNQDFTQALAGYGANQAAQEQSNAAQQQAWQQGQGNYSTAYSSALNNYLQPLNAMQAVLNGQQVQQPNMPSFATAGYTPGADQSGATGALGSWNQGIYNSNVASANSTNAAGAGAIAAIAAAFI